MLGECALSQTALDKPWQVSVLGSSFLATGIYRTHEILLGLDARVTIPTSKGEFEIDGNFANGEGESYRIASLDYRFDLGVDWMPAFVLAGVHGDWWTPAEPYDALRFSGGWHVGGGFLQPLVGGWAIREDIRYRFGPGTSLLIGVGLSYQFSN